MSTKCFHFGSFLALSFLALVFTSGVNIGYGFFTAKWLLLYGIAAFSCAWLIGKNTLPIPDWNRKELFLFGLVFIAAIGNTIWLSPSGFENSLLDRCSFFVLAYFIYVAFERKLFSWDTLLWPVIIGCASTAVYGLWQISGETIGANFPYTKVGSLFGYSNNAAQFIGLCIVYLGFRKGLSLWPKFALWTSCVLGLVYVVLSQCRSVYLGLILVAVFSVLRLVRKRTQIFKALATTALVFFIAVAVQSSREGSFTLYQPKELLTSFRVEMAKSTLHMIRERPLGVGVDAYEFKALPFIKKHTPDLLNEDFLAKSPHNELLRYPAEDGVPASLLFLLLILYLGYRWWAEFRRKENPEDNFVFAFLLFYSAEAVAQFPFQNPLPFFIFSFCLAWLVFRTSRSTELSAAIYRPVLVVIFLVQMSCGYLVTYSRLYEKSNDLETVKQACSYLPSNWHACLLEAKLEMQQEKVQEARVTLENLLRIQPDNLIAMRNLSLVAFHDGKVFQRRLEGCYYLWRYVDGYDGRTALTEPLKHNCPERWIDYFNRKHPSTFFNR